MGPSGRNDVQGPGGGRRRTDASVLSSPARPKPCVAPGPGPHRTTTLMPFGAWVRAFSLSVAIWAAGTVAGFALGSASTTVSTPEGRQTLSATQSLDRMDARQDKGRLCLGILARNVSVYLWLLAGVACAGLSTIVVLAFNGFLMGQLIGFGQAIGASLHVAAWLFLPHGVLEVGALLLAGAIGLQGPGLLMAWIHGRPAPYRAMGLGAVALAGIGALAAAAVIEAYLTVPLARAMAH